MGNLIERGIEPLVNALNSLDFIKTVYSCEGHFDRLPNEKFLPTAYVTFSTTDPIKFERLYRQIYAIQQIGESVSLRMTYDCLLGLYTLSIWPENSITDALEKRAIVDSGITQLSDNVLNSMQNISSYTNREENAGANVKHPCGEVHPPCMLVIPIKELICPFPQPDS